ncbi:MAG: OmpA family protein [Candidatus Hinthialibacter sp.]
MNLLNRKLTALLCMAIFLASLSGCSNLIRQSPLQGGIPMTEINQIFLLADASSSMSLEGKRLQEIDFLTAFVEAMPDDCYRAGLMAFNSKSAILQRLQVFNRTSLLNKVPSLAKMGGATRLETSLKSIQEQLQGARGRTAIVIVSDGLLINNHDAWFAGADLVEAYPDTCIYTVQIGFDSKGTQSLNKLQQLTDCGGFRFASDLNSPVELRRFIHEVFYGVKPAEEIGEAPAGDSDNDGVDDSIDQCPNTPQGAKVDERGCWVIQDLLFDYDKAEIRPEYNSILDEVVEVLKNNPSVDIRVDGHTDSIGGEKYNQALSLRRADAVVRYLITHGVSADRLTAQGWGLSRPVKPNDTPENRQANRRVELTPLN